MELFSGKSNASSDSCEVSEQSVKYLWDQKSSNVTVGACCSYIVSRLLGTGFVYTSSRFEASERFKKHTEKYFIPFAKAALEALLVQGFVVYGVNSRSVDNKFPIPFVIGNDLYKCVVQVKRGEQSLVVSGHRETRKKMFTFVGSMPTSGGQLTSKVALVSNNVSYLDELEKYDMQAFAVRARPPVLTKTKTDLSFDSRDVITGAVPGLRAQDESDNMGLRNKINIEQFKQQHDLIKTLNDNRIDSSSNFWSKHLNAEKQTYLSETMREHSAEYVPRFVPLPNDADIASFGLPEERKDLVGMQKFVKNQICMGMGIPEPFISGMISSGGNSMNSMKTMEALVRCTVNPLRQCMRQMMIEVYANCFQTSDEDIETDCRFVGGHNVNQMLEYHTEGLITFDAIKRIVMQAENLDEDDMVKTVKTVPPPRKEKNKRKADLILEDIKKRKPAKRQAEEDEIEEDEEDEEDEEEAL